MVTFKVNDEGKCKKLDIPEPILERNLISVIIPIVENAFPRSVD